MLDLVLRFVPFFSLVLMGWAAARLRLLAIEGIGTLNAFVLYFALPALLFRFSASGALMQRALPGVLLVYGAAGLVIVTAALVWARRASLSRRDGGMLALVTVFPNTGFLGLPLLTDLLGPQAAGPLAATLIVDVLLWSSLCLAWAHSHGSHEAPGDDPAEAWHAVQASLKGALRNPLLWSLGLGMVLAWLGWRLPHALDETVRLLGLSASPAALFTLGAMLARAQMAPASGGRPVRVWTPVMLKLVAHPLLAWGTAWGMQQAGMALSPSAWITVTLAAALPSASNVSMLAERERADVALITRVILWTTALALITLTLCARLLGVQADVVSS